MTFLDAVKSAYRNYATFSGRAARSDYWWFVLFNVLVSLAIAAVEGGGQGSMGHGMMGYAYDAGPVGSLWSLVNLLPGLALGARRLHDLDKSGWWLLLVLVPLIGWIFLLAWFCMKGTAGANRFGADPLAASS